MSASTKLDTAAKTLARNYAKGDKLIAGRVITVGKAVADGLTLEEVAVQTSIERARLAHPSASDLDLMVLAASSAFKVSKPSMGQYSKTAEAFVTMGILPTDETAPYVFRTLTRSGTSELRKLALDRIKALPIEDRAEAIEPEFLRVLVDAKASTAKDIPEGQDKGTTVDAPETESVTTPDAPAPATVADLLAIVAGIAERQDFTPDECEALADALAVASNALAIRFEAVAA